MKFTRIFLLSVILLACQMLTATGQGFKAGKVTIPDSAMDNVYRIDDGVFRGEQPSAKDFAAMEKFGIREILNLRARHSDDAEAEGSELLLHRIKAKAKNINEGQLIEALRIIKNRKGPILIHCWHGSDRTGAVVAMYRIIFQGATKEQAIEEMTDGGFGFHAIYSNIITTIKKSDTERIKRKLGVE